MDDLKKILEKTNFPKLDLSNIIEFENFDEENREDVKKIYDEHKSDLHNRITSTDLKNYLNQNFNRLQKTPTSRVEVVEIGRWFADKITELTAEKEILSFKEYFEDLTTIITYFMKELIKQNYVICQERGELMNITWTCMAIAFDEGQNFMKKVLEKSSFFHEEKTARAMKDKDKYVQKIQHDYELLTKEKNNLEIKLAASERS